MRRPLAPLFALALGLAACQATPPDPAVTAPLATTPVTPVVTPTTPAPVRGAGATIAIAPDAPLPAPMTADPEVARLYRWAAAHRDLLSTMPCTCGCNTEGHRSNADCYILAVSGPHDVAWDEHGVGCGTCQGITREVETRLAAGESPRAIRGAIEATWVTGGPTTDTPWPSEEPSAPPAAP